VCIVAHDVGMLEHVGEQGPEHVGLLQIHELRCGNDLAHSRQHGASWLRPGYPDQPRGESSGMVEEIDAWRVVNQLLKAKGDGAEAEVERQCQHCEAHGMPDGAAFWQQVAKAVCELRNVEPPGQPH
jgi:hypothetical protein